MRRVSQVVWPRAWLSIFFLIASSSCSGLPHVFVSTDPLTAKEHVQLGAIYDRDALREAARREFEAALTQKPDFVPALIGLGNISFEEGNYEMAEQYYARALEVVPGHPGASNNVAAVYVEQDRRLEEAEQLGLRALAADDALKPYILHTLAAVYMKQGRYLEARGMLNEADAIVLPNQVALRDQITKSRQQLPSWSDVSPTIQMERKEPGKDSEASGGCSGPSGPC
jgi:tetratricopeptide (TPR) repeat protein